MISYESIQLDLPYEVLRIEQIQLVGEMNEHHYLNIEAVIEEKQVKAYLSASAKGKKVSVQFQNKVIYVGQIIKLQIRYKRQVGYLLIKAVSYSYDLDIQKHQRTFTDLNMTYEEVIREVLDKYQKKDCLDKITEGKRIPHLLVQYQETDWAFLKRLATHFEAVLEVDALRPSSRIYFGYEPRPIDPGDCNNSEEPLGKNNVFKTSIINYEVFNKMKALTTDDLYEASVIGWQVESRIYVPLGAQFIFEGKKVCVARFEMISRFGEIIFQYELKLPKAIRTTYAFNEKLKGVNLEAIVKKRRNNQMQLHFCMNEQYKASDTNQWFAYGREISNFYCMPVNESKVHVAFLTGDEKQVVVNHGIRIASEKDKYYSKIAEPNNKSYSTVDGQELLMTPDLLQIAEDDGKSIQITLTKDGQVSVTGKQIKLKASGKMTIGTKDVYHPKENPTKPKKITISAKNTLIVTKSPDDVVNVGHSIELTKENHLRGTVKVQE